MPFFREHARLTLDTGDKLITKQSHKAECDISNILGQYKRTGIITHVQSARATYTDLPSDIDYQSSLNTLFQAEKAFSDLPAPVRAHFQNDPAAFLAAFADPQQEDQLRKFGLLKEAEAQPAKAEAAPAAPPAP